MRMLREGFQVLKETGKEFIEDKATQQSAALSYYTAFSLAPLLVVIIGIAGIAFGQRAVEGQLVGQLEGLMGRQGAELIQAMIAKASEPSKGMIATIVGIVVLLLGATGVFGQLQGSLNDIWEVKPKSRGLWGVIRDRLLSFSALLGLGFLLLVSLVLQAGLSAFSGLLGPAKSIISQVLNQLLSFGVTALLFALIFKLLPDLTIRWRGIWIGALFTALLFAVGKFLIGLYLGRGTVGSAFGAAGSLAIVLLWIYYSSLILFFGAEFTHVLSRRQGWVMAEEGAAPAAPARVPAAPRAGVAPPTLFPRPAPRPAVKPAGRVAGFFLGALGFLAGFLLGKRASV